MRYIPLVVDVQNDNFNSPGSNLEHLLNHPNPDGTVGFDIALIQEGKAEHYRTMEDEHGKRLLSGSEYLVLQGKGKAKAGSVIIARKVSLHGHRLHHGRHGWTFGVAARGLLPRWIAWLRLLAGLVLSGHRPPMRTQRSQPWSLRIFDRANRARLFAAHKAGRWIIEGMDSNEHGGPGWVHSSKYLRWVTAKPGSIDGFIVSSRVVVHDVREFPKWTSDHNGQRMYCEVPA
jgi:hypothetical protein